MFERILVPLDASPLAEAVLTQLRSVLLRKDSEVILLQAALPPAGMDAGVIGVDELFVSRARSYLASLERDLAAQGVRVRSIVRTGGPAEVILSVSEEVDASLIALATHGRSGIPRWILGSVAEKVIRASRVPVLAVRSFRTPGPEAAPVGREALSIRKILVPIDDSNHSLEVVPPAVELAKLYGSKAVILHVCEGHPACSVPVPQLNYAYEHFAAAGVEAIPVMRMGDAPVQILEECRAQDADLIAMSTHGRSGPSRWMLGSVAEKVLRAATVPLLLARSGMSPLSLQTEGAAAAT